MQTIDELQMSCEVIETDKIGTEKIFKGTISELHYKTNGDPYMVRISWNGKSRLICPRFENGAMRIKKKNKMGTIDIFVEE